MNDAAASDHDAQPGDEIAERLKRHPQNTEAQLDSALDQSMDASDPPAPAQPDTSRKPPASSGYDEDEERRRRAKAPR